MARFTLGSILAVVVLCCTSSSADAQHFQQFSYSNPGFVHIQPYPYPYGQYYWIPNNHFGYGYGYVQPQFPVYGRWTVQRTQLDPMRHFFNGNGSSYSHGTSQMWGNPRRTQF